ncbi:hypothetical protein WJX73_006200 [Symbiochloris irregularis]|uniref:Reverse transcriptase n=1 Tax=Symbiochloris irregularis TaxID=706552 RepID=A0AAW1NNZ4_9CHLO
MQLDADECTSGEQLQIQDSSHPSTSGGREEFKVHSLPIAYKQYLELLSGVVLPKPPTAVKLIEGEIRAAMTLLTLMSAAEQASQKLYGRGVLEEFTIFFWADDLMLAEGFEARHAKRVCDTPTPDLYPPLVGKLKTAVKDWKKFLAALKANPHALKLTDRNGSAKITLGVIARPFCELCA